MADLFATLGSYLPLWLISALIVAVGVAIAILSGASRTVAGHVCRVGRRPARIRLRRASGPVAVSVRPLDREHVWVRVEGPAEATFIDGEDTPPAKREVTH